MLANLAKIMVRPRATMRAILESGSTRAGWLIVALAGLSGAIGNPDARALDRLQIAPVYLALIAVAVLAGVFLVSFLFFYLCSWLIYWLGKVMEGTGTPGEVRTAVAWGLAPVVWALLYRVPVALWFGLNPHARVRFGENQLTFNPGQMGMGCITGILMAVLEVTVFFWTLAVLSNTIGEAHRFSGWRGLAAIALTAITPIVIVVAAVLAA